jgi:hypothetical protein
MGKAARNRRIRKLAYIADGTGKHTRSIARALRRHGRFPLPKKEGQR